MLAFVVGAVFAQSSSTIIGRQLAEQGFDPLAEEVARIAASKPGLLLTAGNEAMQIAGVVDAYSEKL